MAEYQSIPRGTNFRDLTGQPFGRLADVKLLGRIKSQVFWLCRCQCGNEKPVSGMNLRTGNVQSCGCLQKERQRKASTTHGLSKTSEYRSYRCMLLRCFDSNHRNFHLYGGKGIIVCDRWRESFENFIADMGSAPSRQHTIDRIDNAKGYEPGNCRWATRTEQMENCRFNRLINHEGKTLTVARWAELTGISREVLWHRVHKMKWLPHLALTTPVKHPSPKKK